MTDKISSPDAKTSLFSVVATAFHQDSGQAASISLGGFASEDRARAAGQEWLDALPHWYGHSDFPGLCLVFALGDE